jgi:lipopolysaccharide export system ATP-binding protein
MTRAPMYRRARAGIGYLAQEPSIFRKLTVEQNMCSRSWRRRVRWPAGAARAAGGAARRARSQAPAEEPGVLSLGGERRRLEITRALVTRPRFMLLDEPFAGVDPIAVHDIQTIVSRLRHRGIGVIITDHNVEQTLEIVDRAYIMFDGIRAVSGTVGNSCMERPGGRSVSGSHADRAPARPPGEDRVSMGLYQGTPAASRR